MTVYDPHADENIRAKTIRLASSIHLREEADGGALVIDDRTLTAARLNKSAYVLCQALSRPRTLEDLVSIFADTANCAVSEALAPVSKLIEAITRLGWIECHDGMADLQGPSE